MVLIKSMNYSGFKYTFCKTSRISEYLGSLLIDISLRRLYN